MIWIRLVITYATDKAFGTCLSLPSRWEFMPVAMREKQFSAFSFFFPSAKKSVLGGLWIVTEKILLQNEVPVSFSKKKHRSNTLARSTFAFFLFCKQHLQVQQLAFYIWALTESSRVKFSVPNFSRHTPCLTRLGDSTCVQISPVLH